MARLLHHMSLVATTIIPLLLLLDALGPATATTAEDTPEKKVGMRFRIPSKEEAQWLDRYAETHQPLGAGPLRMVRASPEEEHWLHHHYRDVATTDDGEGSGGGSGSDTGEGSASYIDFDDDNPYVDALRDWVKRLIKQSLEKGGQVENPFEDL